MTSVRMFAGASPAFIVLVVMILLPETVAVRPETHQGYFGRGTLGYDYNQHRISADYSGHLNVQIPYC